MNEIPWPETIDEWAMVAGSLMAIASIVYYDIFGLRDRGEPVEPDVRSDPGTAPSSPFPTFEPATDEPHVEFVFQGGPGNWIRGSAFEFVTRIENESDLVLNRVIGQLTVKHATLVNTEPHGLEMEETKKVLDALVMERHRRGQEVLRGYGLRTLAEREAQEEIDELVGDGGVVWSSHRQQDPHANRRIRPALNPRLIGKDRR